MSNDEAIALIATYVLSSESAKDTDDFSLWHRRHTLERHVRERAEGSHNGCGCASFWTEI